VMFCLDHAMYALQRLIGSENFALWSLEAEDLMREAIRAFSARLEDHVKAALQAGVRGVFAWIGPEVCIPPLMSPGAFRKYVVDVDKPLIDLIHDGGGRVSVHCHGGMRAVIQGFLDMRVDVLHPIEPPPMGDITLPEAFDILGDRMAVEGNIQTHDIIVGTRDALRETIHAALDAGRGHRHILCPCSGFVDNPDPPPNEVENWLLYIREGVRYAEQWR